MSEVLAEIGGVRITFGIASAGTALLALLLFAGIRMADRRKRSGKTLSGGEWINALGFGLLPAAAVWKAFERQTAAGTGTAVTEPLPGIPWLTENGLFSPCSIEMTAALLCFAGVILWLAIRKEELPGNGDLLLVPACLWAGVRIVSESFRPEPQPVIRYAYCVVILLCLLIWTVRRTRIRPGAARTVGDWIAVPVCIAMIAATSEGFLSVGSPIGDLAVIAGCAVLSVLLALIAGSDCRKMARSASD